MAVIPSGNKTDPYALAMEYLRGQRKSIENARNATDDIRATEAEVAMEPGRIRRRYQAIGDANLDTAKKAREAGFEMSGGRVASRRYGSASASSTKSANEFLRGLREGGVNNPYALAAAMGHAQIESGFNTSASGDGGTASNIFQWREERQQGLREFAARNGGSPDDPYIAGRYAAEEMQTNENTAGKRILNARNLAEANEGMIAYLRPKGAEGGMRTAMHGRERASASDSWYKKITSAKVDDTNSSMPSLEGVGEARVDEEGKRYYLIRPNSSHLGVLAGNWMETTKNLQPDLSAGTDKKGAIAYRYYDPALNQPKTAQVANPVAQDDDEDEEFDPKTGE